MCSGSEAGSYLRPIDSCIAQRKDQGNARTCTESKEEEEEEEEEEKSAFSPEPLAPCYLAAGSGVWGLEFGVWGLGFGV